MIPPCSSPVRASRRRPQHSLQLRHRAVLLGARLAHLKQQTLYTRNQGAQRRYLPTYLKSVLLHFRVSMLNSLRR
ncbi:MAG: hypothetical protein OHK0012_26210 [Synechococcales cyanobacterium]